MKDGNRLKQPINNYIVRQEKNLVNSLIEQNYIHKRQLKC